MNTTATHRPTPLASLTAALVAVLAILSVAGHGDHDGDRQAGRASHTITQAGYRLP